MWVARNKTDPRVKTQKCPRGHKNIRRTSFSTVRILWLWLTVCSVSGRLLSFLHHCLLWSPRTLPLCFIGCGTLFYRTSQCGPGVDRGGVIKISRCVGGLVQYKEGLISIARHSECCLQEYQEILHSNFYTCGFWFKDKIIRQFDWIIYTNFQNYEQQLKNIL